MRAAVCGVCGTENARTERFCRACGAGLAWSFSQPRPKSRDANLRDAATVVPLGFLFAAAFAFGVGRNSAAGLAFVMLAIGIFRYAWVHPSSAADSPSDDDR